MEPPTKCVILWVGCVRGAVCMGGVWGLLEVSGFEEYQSPPISPISIIHYTHNNRMLKRPKDHLVHTLHRER